MTNVGEIYKCAICGNIVAVLHSGVGELVCCGQPMNLQVEKTEEEGNEKHKPVIQKTENGIKVIVGSTPHPMEEAHYIEWIEVIDKGRIIIQNLRPGQAPEAEFNNVSENVIVKAYCNVHGLWKS